MKRKFMRAAAGSIAAVVLASALPATALAAVDNGWEVVDGKSYWYENGVRQGYDANNPNYRGKEIYDSASNAWYWLDNVEGGAKAVSKDVYQESEAGIWGDYVNENGVRCGKWVRYDENGHMIKGWSADDQYYFDEIFGTMAKGFATIEGCEWYFNAGTGVLEYAIGGVPENGWKTFDGNQYWYENYVRQGYSVNPNYRGKEIFDPASNAWYWLDNVQGGAKAVNKDVYQESEAGPWADRADGTGKWVRYDENGHMIKGWSEKDGNRYYFDPVYGTMAKGVATIDGVTYRFNENTGVCEGEVTVNTSLRWYGNEQTTYNDDGTIRQNIYYEYNNMGKKVKETSYMGNRYQDSERGGYPYSASKDEMILSYEYNYEYDANGNRTSYNYKSYSRVGNDAGVYQAYPFSESTYTYDTDGDYTSYVYQCYDQDGNVISKKERTYNADGKTANEKNYNLTDGVLGLYSEDIYEYDGNGYLVKLTENYVNDEYSDSVTVYENDAEGNVQKMTQYYDGEETYVTVFTYANGLEISSETTYVPEGYVSSRNEYDYDANGNVIEEREYDSDSYYVNGEYTTQLRLDSKHTYQYDSNGNETLENRYRYDYDGDTQIEEHYAYTVKTYETSDNYNYTKSYDYYYGHYKYENGNVVNSYDSNDEWKYSNGYMYERDENGATVQYYSYTSDEQYQKVLDYRTEYNRNDTYGSATEVGQTYTINPYSTTYDKDGNRKYYTTYTYKVQERISVN